MFVTFVIRMGVGAVVGVVVQPPVHKIVLP
jgi:hypothetical protein